MSFFLMIKYVLSIYMYEKPTQCNQYKHLFAQYDTP